MLSQGIEVLPDRYAVAMLVGAIILGRGRRFITDWSPFIGLLISYDFLRGFADDLAGRAEFVLPMQADTAIFGIVPTAFLQQTFFNSSSLQWYDYAATLLYFLHFVLPLGFAMLLWLRSRSQFTEFAASLTVLSYGAWLTYLVFPSAPPWLAAQNFLYQTDAEENEGTGFAFSNVQLGVPWAGAAPRRVERDSKPRRQPVSRSNECPPRDGGP